MRQLLPMSPLMTLVILILLTEFLGGQLPAQTQLTISPDKDNTLYESVEGTLSNGAGEHFFAGRTNQATGSRRRGLIAFDLSDAVPPGSIILSVTLTLNVSQTVTGTQNVSLHRALADWGEGTSSAPGNQGGGAAATTGDATWVHRFFPTVAWSNDGGDFSSSPSATESVASFGSYTWGSTPGMVADVQQWLNNPSTNFGWVVLGNEGLAQTAKRFDSKENSNTAARPRLTITFQQVVSGAETAIPPLTFSLLQNYPNPFNPSTNIPFTLPTSGHVTLKVFDVFGSEVASLVQGHLHAGSHSVPFHATGLASGIYYYRMSAGEVTQTRKLILSR